MKPDAKAVSQAIPMLMKIAHLAIWRVREHVVFYDPRTNRVAVYFAVFGSFSTFGSTRFKRLLPRGSTCTPSTAKQWMQL
jgi:hypothetical protein